MDSGQRAEGGGAEDGGGEVLYRLIRERKRWRGQLDFLSDFGLAGDPVVASDSLVSGVTRQLTTRRYF